MILTISNTSKAKVNLNAKLGTLLPDRTYTFPVTVEELEKLANRLVSLASQGAIAWDTSENPLQDDRTEGATVAHPGAGGTTDLVFVTAVASTFIASVGTFIRVEPNINLPMPVQVILPEASTSVGGRIIVKRANSTIVALTVVTSGVDLVDGDTSYIMAQTNYTAAEFVCDGTSWHVLPLLPQPNPPPTFDEVANNTWSQAAVYTRDPVTHNITQIEYTDLGAIVTKSYDVTGLILEEETISGIDLLAGITTKTYGYTGIYLTSVTYF